MILQVNDPLLKRDHLLHYLFGYFFLHRDASEQRTEVTGEILNRKILRRVENDLLILEALPRIRFIPGCKQCSKYHRRITEHPILTQSPLRSSTDSSSSSVNVNTGKRALI